MKRIVMTGGGTAGHVIPNIALIERLKAADYEVSYIGSHDDIEKELIEKIGIPYYGVSSGKLRRYFDLKNFTDPFRVIKGYAEAKKLIKQLAPDVLFSKGGFVSVPVVWAAKKHKVPVVIHESDFTLGLANKMCLSSASKICVNFPETLYYLPSEKAVLTGTPIRKELFLGDAEEGLKFCGFTKNKPVIMVTGGSTGSAFINETIRNLLPTLLKGFQVVHLCGRGKMDSRFDEIEGYRQFEYISAEQKHLFAAADLVISRAGANTIGELLALRKPNILVPLSAHASRGDQILNAESFENQGYSYVIREENLTNETLLEAVNHVYEKRSEYINTMSQNNKKNSVDIIFELIEEAKSM